MVKEFLQARNASHHYESVLNNSYYDINETVATSPMQQFSFVDKHLVALSGYSGYLDPKFVESINPFWLSFRPPSTASHYTFGFIYLFIMIIGIFGNCLVIYMFIRCRSLRTAANTLVINLAVSDFIMLAKTPIIIYNSFHQGPALGGHVCRMYGFIGGLTGTASIATLTAIAIDRYLVIVYPLNPMLSTAKSRSRLLVLAVWIYSITFSLPPALNVGLSKYVPEGYLTSCSFDYLDKSLKARIFMFIFFIFAWCIPFIVITYCYINILKVVVSAKRIQSNKDKNKTEIRLAGIVLYVIALWFMAWSPYALVALFGITGNEDKLTPFGSMVPALFCKTAACIDPYVYAVTHPRFRMEFNRLFVYHRDQMPKYQTSCSRTVRSNMQMRVMQHCLGNNELMEKSIADFNVNEKSGNSNGIINEESGENRSISKGSSRKAISLIMQDIRKMS